MRQSAVGLLQTAVVWIPHSLAELVHTPPLQPTTELSYSVRDTCDRLTRDGSRGECLYTSKALWGTRGGGGSVVLRRGILLGRGRRGGVVRFWGWNIMEHWESFHQYLTDKVSSVSRDWGVTRGRWIIFMNQPANTNCNNSDKTAVNVRYYITLEQRACVRHNTN